MDMDVDKDGVGWRPYLRVKVWVDITKPLVRGSLMNPLGNQTWIAMKYERLPSFCFKCGIFRHPKCGCPNDPMGSKIHESEKDQYKVWLRASN